MKLNEMDKTTSQQFFKAWVEAVQKRKEILSSVWRQPKIFTSYVKGDNASIMQEVAEKLNLICYHRDYYSIDTVLFKEDDLVPGRPQNTYWFRDIRVAFEHENIFNSGLYQEVSHLLITNCDLRVLVTYPDRDERAEMEYLHGIIQGNRNSNLISQEESFLLIFGYEKSFEWNGYVFKDDNWKQLD